jgi:hypothetical protein
MDNNKTDPSLISNLRSIHANRHAALHVKRDSLSRQLKEVEGEIKAQEGALVAYDRVLDLLASQQANSPEQPTKPDAKS